MTGIEYRIATWQDNWGEHRWHCVLKKHVRVTFKRSKRVGWRWMGYVKVTDYPKAGFATRAEALAFAQNLRKELVK